MEQLNLVTYICASSLPDGEALHEVALIGFIDLRKALISIPATGGTTIS